MHCFSQEIERAVILYRGEGAPTHRFKRSGPRYAAGCCRAGKPHSADVLRREKLKGLANHVDGIVSQIEAAAALDPVDEATPKSLGTDDNHHAVPRHFTNKITLSAAHAGPPHAIPSPRRVCVRPDPISIPSRPSELDEYCTVEYRAEMTKEIPLIRAVMPEPLNDGGFNKQCQLPYGLQITHVKAAMLEFQSFLKIINKSLVSSQFHPLEAFLMPANFSSIVGEFMGTAIPKYYHGLARNRHHNGHPDLVPVQTYADNAVLHGDKGIETKASRHINGWQGHNPEDVWLMVFVFDSSTPREIIDGTPFKSFRFLKVIGAQITKSDWTFSGRSGTSRRTITASVNKAGFEKMEANWLYRADPGDRPPRSSKKS